jgi:hypothetical protein
MKKILLIVLLLLLIPSTSLADTHNAARCDRADVITAITAAAAGDTVTVPPGTCTWTTPITITKSLYLIGAGPTSTIINHGYAGTLIDISLTSDIPVRISGFYFKQTTNNPGYRLIQVNGKKDGSFALTKLRIDNNKFEKGSRTVQVNGWVEGLIDNNTFLNCNIAIGINGDNDYAWTRTITAGSANALFIENNTFTTTNDADREPNQPIYHQEGARTVTRYNTFDASAYTNGNGIPYDSHGNQDLYAEAGAFRGQPIVEVYANIFTSYKAYAMMDIRGGSSLIWNNAFTRITGSGHTIRLWEEEAWSKSHFPAGLDTEWPAEDQVTNTFIWGNTLNGAALTAVTFNDAVKTPTFIQENRDYFMHAPQATGGKSTYTDRLGAAGNGADGTLTFSAEGANAYNGYTGYTCPHPLADPSAQGSCDSDTAGITGYTLTGGELDTNAPTVTSFYLYPGTSLINFIEPITATSGAAFTVAGLASALTLTCPAVETAASSMTCANSRTVYQSEGNGTYGYTGTKVVDAASNALAAIESSPSAVNMSTEIENPPGYTLTISNHTGAVVTSSPSGLNCGSTCSSDFENGTVVTVGGYCLPNYTGLTIGGEHCASNGTVTVNGAKSCTAVCTKISPDVAIGSGAAVTLGSGAVGTLY